MIDINYNGFVGVANHKHQLLEVWRVFFQVCQWGYVHDDGCSWL